MENLEKVIDFCHGIKYTFVMAKKRGDIMSPRTGRPLTGESKKDIKLQIRVDKTTMEIIDSLAKELNTTRTGVILKGIDLVRELHKK